MIFLQTIKINNQIYTYEPNLKDAGLHHILTTGTMDMGYVTTKDFDLLNRQLAMIFQAGDLHPRLLHTGYQIHQDHTALIHTGDEGEDYPLGRLHRETDGLITRRTDIALMTKFADCVPVLLFDPVLRIQANIHSGWRGTLLQIVPQTVDKLKTTFGSRPENLLALLGHSIRQCHFEVEDDVATPFTQTFPTMKDCITKDPGGIKTHIALQEIIRRGLLAKGLLPHHIYDANRCTYCDPTLHSYRRDGKNFQLMAVVSQIHDKTHP